MVVGTAEAALDAEDLDEQHMRELDTCNAEHRDDAHSVDTLRQNEAFVEMHPRAAAKAEAG
eukprot:11195462-Lingulodinium_polyedra.AAC.1